MHFIKWSLRPIHMFMLFYLAFLLGEQKISEKDAEASMTTLQAFVFIWKVQVSNIDSVPQMSEKGYIYIVMGVSKRQECDTKACNLLVGRILSTWLSLSLAKIDWKQHDTSDGFCDPLNNEHFFVHPVCISNLIPSWLGKWCEKGPLPSKEVVEESNQLLLLNN